MFTPRFPVHRATSSLSALLLLMLSVFLLGTTLGTTAQAEILKTGEGIYQSLDGRYKIIISYSQPGIFFALGSPVDLQVFNPTQLKKDDTRSLFIRYDQQLKKYSAIVIGKKEYKTNGGSLTVLLDGSRITIDNNNPYLSIVIDSQGGGKNENSILGFLGLEVVVNNRGSEAVALLEANQFNQYRGIIEPYTYQSGQLFLKGKAVEGPIGLNLETPKNVCLKKESVYVTDLDLRRMMSMTDRTQSLKLLARLLRKSKEKSMFDSSIILRVADSIIALDYSKGRVNVIRPQTRKGSETQICVVQGIEL